MEPFIALLSVGLFVVGGILGFQHYREQEARDGQRLPKPPVEMARIEEEVRITRWGIFSRFGLGFSLLIETFALLGSKNIVEQLQASVGFIGSAIVFSLGIALGRERTYKIYRADGAEGPVAASTVTVGSSQ